jgi:hypothetical protein
MIEPLVNQLKAEGNDENERSVGTILYNSCDHDFLTSLSSTWHLVSMDIPNNVSDFHGFKTRIHSFIRDHPRIVEEIKDHFYDELMEHTLKRAFRVTFTSADSTQTSSLFRRFFH